MRMIASWLLGLLLVGACGGAGEDGDARLQQVRDGRLPADNLVIYDRGTRRTMGLQTLGASGSFEFTGPTVVYVFRSFGPGDAAQLRSDGIAAEEFTAYLLPSGESPTLTALQRMQRIGPIDPDTSDEQLAGRFRLGEAGQVSAGNGASPPREPDSASEPALVPQPTQGTLIPPDAAFERLEPLPAARSAPANTTVEDERIADLGRRFNAALAELARDSRDGNDGQEARQSIKEIQLELQALLAERPAIGAQGSTGSASTGSQVLPADDIRPATATCGYYNGLDPSAPATASVNEALTAYAEGFAGSLADYGACGAAAFDEAAYAEHLASYCAREPEKTLRDATVAFVCADAALRP